MICSQMDMGAYEDTRLTVNTDAATGISSTGATLTGDVSSCAAATASFEYGTTTAYGTRVTPAIAAIAAGASATPVSAAVTLAPGTYHYRLVVTTSDNAVGDGPDQTVVIPAPIGPTGQTGTTGTGTTGPTGSGGTGGTGGTGSTGGTGPGGHGSGGGGPSGSGGAASAKCKALKLKGLSLSKAKSKIEKAGCTLGKVRKPNKRKHNALPALVVSKTSVSGTKVSLVLGPKPKRKHRHSGRLHTSR